MNKFLYLAIVALMTLNLADLKAGEDPHGLYHLKRPRWQNNCSKLSTIQVCRRLGRTARDVATGTNCQPMGTDANRDSGKLSTEKHRRNTPRP